VPIHHLASAGELHLRNEQLSYVLRLSPRGRPELLHFGGPIDPELSHGHLVPPVVAWCTEPGRPECPTPGSGDFGAPALVLEQADGSSTLELAYVGHRILAGKPAIPGLPSTYVERDEEADTLEVELADARSGARVFLVYTVFRDLAVVARHLRVVNGGDAPLTLRCAMSASVDLPGGAWELTQLSGGWARECQVVRRPVAPGSQSIGSLRGHSSHHHNPLLILERGDTTEERGDAYGLSLVYSGNFLAEVEASADKIRARIGIHPGAFSWKLAPGEELCTPEAILAYSAEGRGALSEAYHQLFRERLARGPWRDRPRPVLLNSWEAVYCDFDEERLLRLAAEARDLGVELFVLDDGWFLGRDSDQTSLGDWTPDPRKLPGGLARLGRAVEAMGLGFGIWIEPEMVSQRSQLFAAHPDWAIGSPGRTRTEYRHQRVLDLSRPEVVEWIFQAIAGLLRSAPIRYVKWDMNRSITEPFGGMLPAERQGEFFHRYVLGVYALYRRLADAFPEVLFESCSSGGGRFDPGMLACAPQAWTSDCTDAMERLATQWGASLCYPLSSMGAHVSAVPNHQMGRVTSLETRGAVAFFGVLGYELDPGALEDGARAILRDQVAFYKAHRELLQRGRFFRLVSPFEGDRNHASWMCASRDAQRAIVGYYRVLQHVGEPSHLIRLRGLDPAARYRVSAWPGSEPGAGGDAFVIRGGDELTRVGLLIPGESDAGPRQGDFGSRLFVLERCWGVPVPHPPVIP